MDDMPLSWQLGALVQDPPVMPGNSRCAGIEIKVWLVVKLANLLVAEFIDGVTVPQSQDASADAMRCFNDLAIVSSAFQFVGNRQTGNAGTEY
jgi:hypothetical protein